MTSRRRRRHIEIVSVLLFIRTYVLLILVVTFNNITGYILLNIMECNCDYKKSKTSFVQ
jgi:uncharacterized membrane protein (DUF485 family)